MTSGSARNCFQRNWPFRQSAASAVIWRRLLTMLSFTARSCSRCASFLKVTWFASWMESSSSCSVCSNVVPKLNRQEHSVFLCLLGIMRVVIWTTRKKELYDDDDESFSFQTLVAFYKHQIKVKIRSERKRSSLLEFGKRWVTVARLCRVVGASLTFN